MAFFYITDDKGVKEIFLAIDKGNPPDGMTMREWKEEIGKVMLDCQEKFLKAHSIRIFDRYERQD